MGAGSSPAAPATVTVAQLDRAPDCGSDGSSPGVRATVVEAEGLAEGGCVPLKWVRLPPTTPISRGTVEPPRQIPASVKDGNFICAASSIGLEQDPLKVEVLGSSPRRHTI